MNILYRVVHLVEAPERPKDDVGVIPTVIFDLTFRCGDFSGKMMGKFFSLPKLVQKSWYISEG